MKKILVSIVFIICVFGSFVIGFYYCKEKIIHGESSVVYKELDRIAIVNLDEGTHVDGEKILYSGELLNFALDYVYVGLNEAQKGIETDMYAAYIIIPSNFSECIESINRTPKQAEIEYVLNPNLTDENHLNVQDRLNTFKELLNANATYVYLNSVLREFHNVQDSAVTIMQHDKVDLDNIQSIDPEKIFNMIEFSEMKEIENNIENVNLAEYKEKSSEELNNIFAEINNGMTKGKEKYKEITNEHNNVATEIENVKDAVTGYNPLIDDSGNTIYQTGLDNLDKAIDEYNENVDLGGSEGIETLKEGIKEICKEYVEIVLIEIQKHTDVQLEEIQKGNNDIVSNKIATWKGEQESYYQEVNQAVNERLSEYKDQYSEIYKVGYEKQKILLSDIVKQNALEIIKEIEELEIDADSKKVALAYISEYMDTTLDEIEIIEPEDMPDIMKEIDFSEFGKCIPDFETDKIVLPEVDKLQTEQPNDEEEPGDEEEAEDNQDESDNEEETVDNQANRNSEEGAEDNEGDTDEEEETESEEEIDKISIDVDEVVEPEQEIPQYIIKKEKDIETLLDYAKSKVEMSKSKITDIIDGEIIGSIVAENEKEISNYGSVTRNLIDSMQTYNSKIETFNPYDYISKDEISKYELELSKNITALEGSMNSKNTEYFNFINKLYKYANDNIATLQKDMQTANDASKSKLNTVIDELKTNKESISKEDDEILGSFVDKLPYTRLGSLEYTEMQKFMATPIDIYYQNKEEKKAEVSSTEDLQLDYRWMIVTTVFLLLVMIVIGMIVKIVKSRKELKLLENE